MMAKKGLSRLTKSKIESIIADMQNYVSTYYGDGKTLEVRSMLRESIRKLQEVLRDIDLED